MRVRGPLALTSALAVLVVGLALPEASSARPVSAPPAAPVATAAALPAPEVNEARLILRPAFASQMAAEGVRLIWAGRVTGTGNVRDVRLTRQNAEMFMLNATLTVRGPSGSLVCRQVGVDAVAKVVRCVRANGTLLTLFRLADSTSKALPERTYSQKGALRVASASVARYLQRVIGSDIFVQRPVVGDFGVLRQLPARNMGGDQRAGCDRNDYGRDTLVNRGWAVQQLVNNLPQNLTVSQWVKPQGQTTYRLVTPKAPQTNLGQPTPLKEGGKTENHKKIWRGSQFNDDYFSKNGLNYECQTLAPYVVSPGPVDPAKDSTPWYTEAATAWNYDGVVRTPSNNNGARPTWWAHPRQSDYDSPTGWFSWTCRGTPSGKAKADTYWQLVQNQKGGFHGDAGEQDKAAGSAPDCLDDNLKDSRVVTKYSVSKLGYMKGRGESGWPRGCAVDGGADIIGCGQEVYSLEYLDGFRRAWAFQHHVFASALRARISSSLSVKVPAAFDPLLAGYTKSVSWRIYEATITGQWPRFTDADGKSWNLSGAGVKEEDIDFSTPSAYTVPGTNTPFTLSGYGSPDPGIQTLTFKLIADVDGNGGWTSSDIPAEKAAAKAWPTVQEGPNKGLELARPVVTVTLQYDLSNFNDNRSCSVEMDPWWSGWNGTTDNKGIHCLEGTIPTIWTMSTDPNKNERREVDRTVPDKNDKQQTNYVDNQATAKMRATVSDSCFNKSQVSVSNSDDPKASPVLGADYTWKINITGTVDTFSACPS